MHWLIIGGNLQNKGAELMLTTVALEIKKRNPNDHIIVNGSTGEHSLLKMKGLLILDYALPHIGSNWKFIPIVKFGNIYKYFKKKYRGDVALDDIDIVLDISGFALGDIWGIQPLKNVYFLTRFLIKKGIKYIFLPQAFGPFENKRSIRLMKDIIANSSACIARDEASYANLIDLHTLSNKILIYPDITLKSNFRNIKSESFISFIPNVRMLDKAGNFWHQNYIPIIIKSLKQIIDHSSFEIKIVIHDKSEGDTSISQKISNEIRNRIEIIDLDDPQEIKKLIARSHFLISSRYHGLAAGLSNNVPSIAMGWSHKYFQLLKDYGLSEFVVSQESDINNLQGLIKKLLNKDENEMIREKISKKSMQIKQRIDNMWDKIMILSNSES